MNELAEKLQTLDDFGRRWADARREKVRADHMRKVVLAKLMRQAEAMGFRSAAAQEREARAADEYSAAIIKLAESEAAEILTRTEYLNRRDMLSAWQTDQANRRAEIRGQI